MSRPLTIALDGPAGSGKSTVAKAVAARLGLPHVDTGAMYRAVALKALASGVDANEADGLDALLATTLVDLHDGRVWLDGNDVSVAVRAPEVTAIVSQVAAQPGVRQWMLQRQRSLVAERGGVMEGRDIATVVLPGADCKFFLTASPQERARRRAAELQAGGTATTAADVLEEIEARDRQDSGRAVAPLRVAPGAPDLDSTGRSIDEVVDQIVRQALGQG
ncbi:MAG: (d)CMP kinase [Actinomycetota bacterium]